jgi:hypothetical protein
MNASPHTILAVLSLLFAVFSLAPWPEYRPYLLAVAVILLSIAALISK